MITPDFFAQGFTKIIEAQSFFSFVAAFISGMLVSLTPCVYPVIPITFSVVTAAALGHKHKGLFLSIIYALGISAGYTALGLVAALTGSIFGRFSNHPVVLLAAGNVFLFFALAMFNAINIPGISLWRKEYSQFSGGYWYVFFFGVISSLTISPCVFPALGVILTIAAQKKSIVLGSGLLFSFSLGMGLVFVMLGFLGTYCINLPKSGRWLNFAKKVMGTVFLLMAEYFIMKAGRLL